jgi:hypothetical protein
LFENNPNAINLKKLKEKDIILAFKEIREDLKLFTEIVNFGVIFLIKFLKTNDSLKDHSLKLFLKIFFQFINSQSRELKYDANFNKITGF